MCWLESGEKQFVTLEIVQFTKEKVKIAIDRLRLTHDRKKKYLDQKHIPKTFEVGKKVKLKVSPWKRIICLKNKAS